MFDITSGRAVINGGERSSVQTVMEKPERCTEELLLLLHLDQLDTCDGEISAPSLSHRLFLDSSTGGPLFTSSTDNPGILGLRTQTRKKTDVQSC